MRVQFSLYTKLAMITILGLIVAIALVFLEIKPTPLVEYNQFVISSWNLVRRIEGAIQTGAKLGDAAATSVASSGQTIMGTVRVYSANWDGLYSSDGHSLPRLTQDEITQAINSNQSYSLTLPIIAGESVVGYLTHTIPAQILYNSRPLYNTLLPYRIILAIVLFVLIIYLATVPIRKRFDSLALAMGEIASGNLSIQTPSGVNDELGLLGRQLKDMADRLQQASLRRDRMERVKNNLIAGVSHDLRSPLTSVLGYAELIMGQHQAGEDVSSEHITVILEKAKRMKTLVDGLFQLTRFRLGEVVLQKVKLDVRDLIEQVLTEFRFDFISQGREVRIEAPAGLLAPVDGELLSRLLENLLSNSYEHASGATWVEVGAMEGDGHIQIWVGDDGPGIPLAIQEFIFDRWYQGDGPKGGQGGLGLALCREIALLHGGDIRVESEEGLGTRFVCTFPVP